MYYILNISWCELLIHSFIDLPSLQTITLGQYAFQGDENDNRKSKSTEPFNFQNTLTMKSNKIIDNYLS